MNDERRSDDDGILAAEYALRLLDEPDLSAARERVRNDPAFARLVDMWDVRLASLADDIAPQQPDDAAKRALMKRLFPQQNRLSFWSRLPVWRALAFASLAMVAMLGIALIGDLVQPQGRPDSVQATQIASQEGDFRALVVLDRAASQLHLVRLEGEAPQGRVLQFWAHGPDQPAMSVGLIPDTPSASFAVPDFLNLTESPLTFGISEEPPGGSTTGQPSGRVFGTADIDR